MKRIICATLVAVGYAGIGLTGALAQNTPTPAPAPAAKPAKVVNIDFKDTAIRDALDTLFKGTGLNYALTPEAAQTAPTVTINLQDVTFDAALSILTKSTGLRYRKDRDTGVYMIEPKAADAAATPVTGTPTTPDTAAATPDVTPTLQIEKIPMNYVDSLDIYGTLTGQGSNRAANMMGGSSGGFGNSGGFGGGGYGNSGGFGGGGFGNSGGFGGGGFGNNSFGGGGFGSSGFGGGFGSSGFGGGGFGGGGFGGGGFGGGGYGGFGR